MLRKTLRMSFAVSAARTHGEVKLMDWIPVTERLPEVSQIIDSTNLILVTVLGSSGKTFVTAMRYVKRTIRNKCVYRWEWDGIISPWEVVAWKPLPEAWNNDNHGELVRCENCRYFKKYPINTESVECGRCSLLMIEKRCDGYCDEGKQKVAETGGDDSGRTD